MSQSLNETIVVTGERDAVESILREINAHSGSESAITERKNFDGDLQGWIAIGNLTVSALTFVLAVVKEAVASKKVKKIRVGDIEIENPSAMDIELLHRSIEARTSSPTRR